MRGSMSVLLPPKIPYLSTPVPQRTDPENFRPRMDLFLIELPEVVSAINVVVDYIDGAKMDVSSMEAVRDAAYQARNDTQALKIAAEQSLDQIGNQKIAAIDQLTFDRINEMDLLTEQKIAVMELIRDAAQSSATSAAASAAAAGQAAGYPEFLAGTEGKPLTRMRDGSGVHFSEEFTTYKTVAENTSLVIGERYRVDSSLNAMNLILLSDPFSGATIFLFDARGTWHKNSPVLMGNGKTIMGLAEDCKLDKVNVSLKLVFDGNDWRVL